MHLCDSCDMKNCSDRITRDLQNPACVISCSDYIGGPPTFLEIAEQCEKVYGPYAPTNADRIRAMSDEELAVGIKKIFIGKAPWCDHHCKLDDDNSCNTCLKEWLKQPAEECQ